MNTVTKLITLLALAIGGALGTGCAVSGPLYVDNRFAAEERAEIQAAADAWTAVGAPVELIWDAEVNGYETDRRTLIRCGDRAAKNMAEVMREPGHVAVWHDERTILVNMDAEARTGDSLQAAIGHEMGHMLGMAHVGTAETALMSEVRSELSPTTPSAVDVAECRAIGACTSGARGSQKSDR